MNTTLLATVLINFNINEYEMKAQKTVTVTDNLQQEIKFSWGKDVDFLN